MSYSLLSSSSGSLSSPRTELKNNDLAAARETLEDVVNRYKEIDRLYAANQ